MPKRITSIIHTTAGGGKELSKREPPTIVQGHDKEDAQLLGHQQGPYPNDLNAVAMDQVKAFLREQTAR